MYGSADPDPYQNVTDPQQCFLSMKTDVNVPSKRNEKIKVRKKIYLVAILKATEEKSRIQIHGFGSATLVVI